MDSQEQKPKAEMQEQDLLRERKKRIFSIRTLVFLVLAAVIIYLLVSNIDVKQTAEAFKKADVSLVLLSAFFYLLSNVCKSVRFSVMMKDSGISVPKMFSISAYQNFFNQIMPARTGELTFLYYTKTIAGVRPSVSLHTLLVSRMMDLVVVCLFFAVCLIILSGKNSSPVLLAASVLLGVISLVCAFKMEWFVSAGRFVFFWTVSFLKLDRKPFVQKIGDRIDMIHRDFADIKMKNRMPMIAFTSLLVWIFLYIFSYTTIRAFGSELGLMASIVGSTGAVLTNVLPVNSFGSFGTLEAGWTGGFVFVGMTMQTAVTTGFGYHLINFFAAGIIALVCVLVSGVIRFMKRKG